MFKNRGFSAGLWGIPVLYFCVGFIRPTPEFYSSWIHLCFCALWIALLTKLKSGDDLKSWIQLHPNATKFVLLGVVVLVSQITLGYQSGFVHSFIDGFSIFFSGIYFVGACAAFVAWIATRFSKSK